MTLVTADHAVRRGADLNPRSWVASVAIVALPTLGAIGLGLTAQVGREAFFAAGVLLILALTAYLVALRDRPELLVGGFLVWLTVERFVVAALTPILDPETLRLLLGYKELFFPVLALVALPNLPRVWREAPSQVRVVDGLALVFGVVVLASFLLSPAPVLDRLVYARRLALLPLAYGVVRLLPWQLGSLRGVTRMVVLAGLAVAAFGFFERFVGESLVWRELIPAAYYYHLSSLADLSAAGTDFPLLGLPVTFWDFTWGLPVRRAVSTFLEATTLASFLALAAILAVATVRPLWKGILVGAIIGLAGVLTLGKAGWLILLVGIAYLLVAAYVPRLREPAWLASLAAAVIVGLAIISLFLQASGSTTGALAHFEGLRQGIRAVIDAPFGHGLGIGGNFGAGTLAAESAVGVIMVQIGLPGLVAWVAWLLGVAFACTRIGARVREEPLLGPALGVALVAFFATAFYTESAGGFLGNWLYAVLPAALLSVAAIRQNPGLEPVVQ